MKTKSMKTHKILVYIAINMNIGIFVFNFDIPYFYISRIQFLNLNSVTRGSLYPIYI